MQVLSWKSTSCGLFLVTCKHLHGEQKKLSFRFQELWRTSSRLRTTSDPIYRISRLPSSPLFDDPPCFEMDSVLTCLYVETLWPLHKSEKNKNTACGGSDVVYTYLFMKTSLLAKSLRASVTLPEDTWMRRIHFNGWIGVMAPAPFAVPTVHRHLLCCFYFFFFLCLMRCGSCCDPLEYVINFPWCASPATTCCVWCTWEVELW